MDTQLCYDIRRGKALRFTFSQKLEIAYLMGLAVNDPTLLPTVEALNRIRNQVAHTFALDREAVDELLRINHEDYDGFKPKDDRQRVQALRYLCRIFAEELPARLWPLMRLPQWILRQVSQGR